MGGKRKNKTDAKVMEITQLHKLACDKGPPLDCNLLVTLIQHAGTNNGQTSLIPRPPVEHTSQPIKPIM